MKYYNVVGYPGYIVSQTGKVFRCGAKGLVLNQPVEVTKSEHVILNGRRVYLPSVRKGRLVYEETGEKGSYFHTVVVSDTEKGTMRIYETRPEEGEFTLAESIAKCRTKAAFEEICESNGIPIPDMELLRHQKLAVLEGLGR